MLAPLRRLLLALVALAACTPDLFGGVICTPNADGTWTCSGDGWGDYPPGTVVTNVVGVCTNCVAMSPSDCQSIKDYILDTSYEIGQKVSSTVTKLYSVEGQLEALQTEGDSFSFQSQTPTTATGSEQWKYVVSRDPSVASVNTSNIPAGQSVNSIANYYQQAVKPVLDSVIPMVSDSLASVDYIGIANVNIQGIVSSVNCSACTASFGGSPTNVVGGGSSSGDCPCKEQMVALQNLLKDDFLPRIKKIDTNVAQLTNLIAITREQLRVTKEGFHNVTNLFNRLDDYVLDDFSNKVYQIRVDVNYIASNLASKVASLFINNNYSNAVYYLDNDGSHFQMSELKDKLVDESNTESRFDFGEFSKLPWFTRIEFLLTDIAGYYEKTNTPLSEAEQVAQKLRQFEASAKIENNSMSNKVSLLAGDKLSSVGSSLSRLWGYFSFFGANSQSSLAGVEIIGGDLSEYFGDNMSSIHIYAFDNDSKSVEQGDKLISVFRYGFQAFYLAALSFLLFRLMLFLYAKLGLVINLLLKFYASIFGSS